jgi:hypothetical protein
MAFPQGLKPRSLSSLNAQLKPCSTPWSDGLPGLNPQYLHMAFAAIRFAHPQLKLRAGGRSSMEKSAIMAGLSRGNLATMAMGVC